MFLPQYIPIYEKDSSYDGEDVNPIEYANTVETMLESVDEE